VAEPPACNASPLIVLCRAGHLALLRAVYTRVIVPGAVVEGTT
jgi:predicted nucleic acid-binding protein